MNSVHRSTGLIVAGLLSAGCIVVPSYEVYRPAPQPVVEQPVAPGPVIVAPGVEVIEVEPAPVDRVYAVYDPGYPPGCYFYQDFYWYNGYRYPRDVFVNQYVTVNIRENRFTSVEENRRMGQRMEIRQRNEYATNHGVRPTGTVRPGGVVRPGATQGNEKKKEH